MTGHYAAEAEARRLRARVETLPHGPKASDQAGDLLGVSGRTVRDLERVA